MNAINTENNSIDNGSIVSRCLQSCGTLLAGIDQTKTKIAAEFQGFLEVNRKSFQLALKEAEALAWQTDYPHLLFPALAMEKVQAAAAWQNRQNILRQPRDLFAEAA